MRLNFKTALLILLTVIIGVGSFAYVGNSASADDVEIFGVASNSFGYYIYVADSIHNRVIKYDLDGNYLNDFIKTDKKGSCPNWDYKGLIAVSVCRVTDVFAVTDYVLRKVFTFNPNAVPHHPLGDPSKNELLTPWHASETENGDTPDIGNYVVDKDGNKFNRYDPPSINFDKQAVECDVFGKVRFSVPNGYTQAPAPAGSANGQFKSPEGICVDRRFYVLVADTGNNRIQKFRSNGEFVMKWGEEGNGPGQFNKPVYIIPDFNNDSPNRYYVCDQGNHRIQIFNEQGKFLDECKPTKADGSPLFDRVVACAIDMDYNIWVADAGTQSVYKLGAMDSPNKFKLLLEVKDVMNPPPIFTHVSRVKLGKYFWYVDETTVSLNQTQSDGSVRKNPPAQIKEGRTIVPIRMVADYALSNSDDTKGATYKVSVAWDPLAKKATLTMPEVRFSDKLVYPKKVVELWIGKPIAKVNGKDLQIDSNNPKVIPDVIKGEYIFVPLRFIAEAFGAEVRWKAPEILPVTPQGEVIILMPDTRKVKEAYGTK